jgi:hypothetical protein
MPLVTRQDDIVIYKRQFGPFKITNDTECY